MEKIGKLRHAGRTENTTWSDSSTYQIIETVNRLVDAHIENFLEQERKVVHFETTIDTRGIEERAKEEERKRILSLPCMEEEPVEKDSGPIYLKGEFGGEPIPYHQSIKLPIETNIARNAIRREIRDALQSK